MPLPPSMNPKDENKLIQQMTRWMENHFDLVQNGQAIANDIHKRGLVNMRRPMPFEIIPSNGVNDDGFEMNIFLDHPSKAQVLVRPHDFSIDFIPVPEFMSEAHTVHELKEALDLIATYDDMSHKQFKELRNNFDNRDLRKVNDTLTMWLIEYHDAIDPKLEEIKAYLNGIESAALFSDSDGLTTPLNRVLGRWDLALLWSPCRFVAVGDPEKTFEIKKKVTEFAQAEARAASLLCSGQIACMMEGKYDIELRTDSPDGAADGSGWLNCDEYGVPQLGPIIHATRIVAHSKLEIVDKSRVFKSLVK